VSDSPYTRFDREELILRDELAVDRTLLANERTLLAYLRSAVGLAIAGVTILHFSSAGWFRWFGLACIPLGLATGILGVVRYRRMNRAIALVRKTPAPPA
jgi:putative membrane protein